MQRRPSLLRASTPTPNGPHPDADHPRGEFSGDSPAAATDLSAPERGPAWPDGYVSEITPWLWVGGHLLGRKMVAGLTAAGVTHLLSVADQFQDDASAALTHAPEFEYLQIPWPDDSDHPAKRAPLDFLTALGWVLDGDHARSIHGQSPVSIYVHCRSGKHRGPLMAIFLLSVFAALDPDDAAAFVRTKHPRTDVWSTPHYHKSTRRAVKIAKKLLTPLVTMGPLGQQALSLYAAQEEGAAPGAEEVQEDVGPQVAATTPQRLSAADEARLTAGGYDALRTAFLARWAELGLLRYPVLPEAATRLHEEAKGAARTFVRTHNLGLTRAALDGRSGTYLQDVSAPRAAQLSAHLPRLGRTLADLYAAGPDSRFQVVDDGAADGQAPSAPGQVVQSGGNGGSMCSVCRHFAGRTLTSAEAWQHVFPAHLGCTHRLALLPPSVSA